MPFHFGDLDEQTRGLMLSEIDSDVAAGTLYGSKRFNESGTAAYPGLLRAAAAHGDEGTLAASLASGEYFIDREWVNRQPKGYWKDVPRDCARTLAEGEFNRFYMRAVCLKAAGVDSDVVEVYRAKAVTNPRPESEILVGMCIEPADLLADLRANKGFETIIGLAVPNSGLSVRIKN
jgi:hypothetical protein